MEQSGQIVIASSSMETAKSLATILEFVGEQPFIAENNAPEQWQSTLSSVLESAESATNKPVTALILAAEQEEENLKAILVNLPETLPVLLYGNGRMNELGLDRLVIQLDQPLQYSNLMDALHRAQLYRAQFNREDGARIKRDAQLFRSLVGNSRSICQVREMMAQVADKDVTVLITGESGTGKEVVARNLHYQSHRRHKPFVPVNCGAIPADLLESELFGHEKGAFTGAISSRAGRFELAQGGTLFLDEIGDMPLPMQVKLLRVLQEKTFERVGGSKTLMADVRIIAATHKNLEKMVEEGTFREDLYYRLNVFPIEMPALRERIEDLPILLNELVSRVESETQVALRFSSSAIMSLCQHPWKGNVRELANLVERMSITNPCDVIGVKDLPPRFKHVKEDDEEVAKEAPIDFSDTCIDQVNTLDQANVGLLPVNGLDLKDYLGNLESSLIQQALEDSNGVVARAAEKLRIRRTTLVEKMRKYNLNKPENTVSH